MVDTAKNCTAIYIATIRCNWEVRPIVHFQLLDIRFRNVLHGPIYS